MILDSNILNGEGYSKLKQIVKVNVKAALSGNKILVSAAFAALLQTLQNDPEMIKAIYNISPRTIINKTKIITITLPITLKSIRIAYYI
jgi:hypothetical protein